MEDPEPLTFKIILLGEANVGKTSIISRYLKQDFIQNYTETISIGYYSKDISLNNDEKSIKFKIWDTPGMEGLRRLLSVIYYGVSAIIVVYDKTNKKSFEAIKNYWIKEIREKAPKDIGN